jgi:hypothetical protein
MDGTRAAETTLAVAPQESLPLLELGVSALGLLVLGAAVGLGTGDALLSARVGPGFALPIGGAMLLTTPGLVVAHQFLDVPAPLGALVGGVARGLRAAGVLAWGFAPFAAYFSATAPGWWPVLAGVLGAVLASTALVVAGGQITRVEWTPAQALKWNGVVVGWVALTAAIGVRLAVLGWQGVSP